MPEISATTNRWCKKASEFTSYKILQIQKSLEIFLKIRDKLQFNLYSQHLKSTVLISLVTVGRLYLFCDCNCAYQNNCRISTNYLPLNVNIWRKQWRNWMNSLFQTFLYTSTLQNLFILLWSLWCKFESCMNGCALKVDCSQLFWTITSGHLQHVLFECSSCTVFGINPWISPSIIYNKDISLHFIHVFKFIIFIAQTRIWINNWDEGGRVFIFRFWKNYMNKFDEFHS